MKNTRTLAPSSTTRRSSERGFYRSEALQKALILLPALVLGLALPSRGQQATPAQFQTWARYWPSLFTNVIGMRGQVGDLNEDGILDVVVTALDSPFVGLGQGNGEFAWQLVTLPPPPPPGIRFTNAVAVGRLRPGAKPEIVVGRDLDGPQYLAPLVLLSMDASGAFKADTTGRLPQIPSNPLAVLLVDVDKDADLDLLVSGSHGQPSMLWLNNGQGRFQDATATHLPFTNWSTMDAVQVDVNGDGWPDIACSNGGYAGRNRDLIYMNDGTGRFIVQWLSASPGQSASIATADFDSDGWPDLYVGEISGSNPQKLYMNQRGNGFLDSTNLLPRIHNGDVVDVLATDVDGDGRPDLVVGGGITMPGNLYPTMPRVFLNRYPSAFVDRTDALVPRVSQGTTLLLAGDFDLDGDEDILMQRKVFLDNSWRLLFNLRRHLYTQDQVQVGAALTIQCWADPNHLAMPFLSFAPARLPLPGLGVLGLDPVRSVTLPLLLHPPDRRVTLTLQVPSDPSLRGHAIYTQALDLDPQNLSRSYLTNWVRDVIQ